MDGILQAIVCVLSKIIKPSGFIMTNKIPKKVFLLINQAVADNAERALWETPVDGSCELIIREAHKDCQRTTTQNASMHKYLALIAHDLAESGQDMRKIVKLPITPTMENVKENMWKPVMNALYPDKTSTTKLSTTEIQEVYETFNAAISERLGVGRDWPSIDSQLNESLIKK